MEAPLQARQAAQVATDARLAADMKEELGRSLMGSVDTKVTLVQQEEVGDDWVCQAGEAVAVLQRLLQEGGDKAAVRDCGGAPLP